MKATILRIPDNLLERIKTTAQKNKRSMNSEILQAIEVYLETQEKPIEKVAEKTS